MESKLEELLEENRATYVEALREAERELADLELRRRHLLGVIERGRVVVGQDVSENIDQPDGPLTLHAAMARVLSEHPDGLRPTDLTRAVNDRGLYRKRDGTRVESAQIHARIGHYGDIFEKRDGCVFLKEGAA